jgi:hypothetical protein
MFLVASYAGAKSIEDVAKIFPSDVQLLAEDETLKILDKFEVQDILHVEEEFLKNFFGVSSSLTYEEYREKIVNNEYDWFLSAPGIREQLEKGGI